jgi:hypothetical protein
MDHSSLAKRLGYIWSLIIGERIKISSMEQPSVVNMVIYQQVSEKTIVCGQNRKKIILFLNTLIKSSKLLVSIILIKVHRKPDLKYFVMHRKSCNLDFFKKCQKITFFLE